MSVQTEIDRIITAVGAAYDAVEVKGGTLPTSETVANLAEAINSIPKDTHQAVEQATPSLTLNAATGVVTAEATQAAGLVAAGTKKATMQLATQAAKTVTPSAAQQTAVASGKYTTGNVVVAAVPTETKTVELSMPSGNQTVSPSSGKFLSEVTVKKPATMLPENIKKGVSIGGVVGTLESGGGSTSETWVLKAELAIPDAHVSYPVDATMYSNNYQRDVNVVQIDMASEHLTFFVLNDDNNRDSVNGYAYGEWYDNSYRKLVFNVPPTGDLLTWLTANGVKQPANLAVQPSKNVTITSNGTVSVTPDAPYDGLSSVDVTVNVASGGGGSAGFKVTFPATATNWNLVSNADLLLSDGTVKSFLSYSDVSGKTIENVVGIHCISQYTYYVLQMTLSEGSLAQCTLGAPQSSTYRITTQNNTTITLYGSGKNTFWWPLADTVISAIEMYNTD